MHYFPILYDYLDGNKFSDVNQQDYAPESEPFDYGSIMIYSSTSEIIMEDGIEDTKAHAKFPILKKNADGSPPTYPESLTWVGNCNGDLDKVRVSAYDIKRIAAIYPGTAVQQEQAAKLGGARGTKLVNWLPGRYHVPGVVERLELKPNPFNVAWADENGNILPDLEPQAVSEPDNLAADIAAMAIETEVNPDSKGGSGSGGL